MSKNIAIRDSIGNLELLKLTKVAFLCSRKIPAGAVLKCYDWAIAQREAGNCVVSGFHSQLEKDVLHYLLKGQQPIIVALARGLKIKLDSELQKPLDDGRLLIVTPFTNQVTRVTTSTAYKRNEFMIDLADKITVGYSSRGGQVETALSNVSKQIEYL